MLNVVIKFLLLGLLNTNINNIEYNDYQYVQGKKELGITYELTNVLMGVENLELKGWAYIPETQHYTESDEIEITIMSYKSGGKKKYFSTNISTQYDLSNVENYTGVRDCNENEFLEKPQNCNYKYKNVSFDLKIPMSDFS